MITFSVEKIENILEEIKPLLEDHWKEVAIYQDKIELCPDYDRYLKLEEMGMLHIVVAREDGKIVGYFISLINKHLHYSNNVYALNDILYLKPSLRATGVAAEMFIFAEEHLKDLGVSVIVLHMKTHIPFEGLAKELGYEKVEYNYSKYVGK